MNPTAGVALRAVDAMRAAQTFTREQVAYLLALAYDSGRMAAHRDSVAEVHVAWETVLKVRRTYEQRVAERIASFMPRGREVPPATDPVAAGRVRLAHRRSPRNRGGRQGRAATAPAIPLPVWLRTRRAAPDLELAAECGVTNFDPERWPPGWDLEDSPEGPAAGAGATAAELAGDFWEARRSLAHIFAFARARRVAPWAVLGAVLARVVAATEPSAQLPPTIGSFASLNLFVGLVGPPGAGKDAARKVAKEAVELPPDHDRFLNAPLGSGEGLSHMFMRETKDGPDLVNTAALVTVGEIDTLTALVKRQSSTVSSQLRQAAMGEELGFFYVDTAKRMMVPEHRYRMCLLAGIQPKRAGGLLEDADGGTPQRFVWLPAVDSGAPDVAPECPEPMLWVPPDWLEAPSRMVGGMLRKPIQLPRRATDMVVSAHLARTRGKGDGLDGHAILTRLKVAAALAILEGRAFVDDADWDLSGHVMAVSSATRARCVRELSEESRRHNSSSEPARR